MRVYKGYGVKQVAKRMQNWLVKNQFAVQRYDSQTSNSVYFKLDYGVCHSLRISDHRGKSHLCYRYNLSFRARTYYVDNSGKYPMYVYPMNETGIVKLMNDIRASRKLKIEKYGEEGYRYFMAKQRRQNDGKLGFWSKAILISE